MRRSHAQAFTLIEMLVSIAILGILFGLLFKPVVMATEVLSISRSERQVQRQARGMVDRVAEDLEGAYRVYPNLDTFDLAAEGLTDDTTARWRTPQVSRLDLALPARTASGDVRTPLQPSYQNSSPEQLNVVTYWVMRSDPRSPYDPESNPRVVYRAIHSYDTSAYTEVPTPDDLWDYALYLTRQNPGETLATLSDDIEPLFQRVPNLGQPAGPGNLPGPFDWLIYNIDDNAWDPATSWIMRSPDADTTGSHARSIAAVSRVTDRETDIFTLQFLPTRSDMEELAPDETWTAYRGRLGRWVQPYQRETPDLSGNAIWTMPSNGIIAATWGDLPIVAMFRTEASRDGAGPLGEEYVLTIEQRPGNARVGHPLLYRVQPDDANDPVLVYDLTDYPKRVFIAPPGDPNTGLPTGEFACHIDWDTGRVVTAFDQTDVICPFPQTGDGVDAIHALNDYVVDAPTTGSPPAFAAPNGGTGQEWQGFRLTTARNGNAELDYGLLLDDFVASAPGSAVGLWDSFTLSAFRPERLQTAGLTNTALGFAPTSELNQQRALSRRQLQMSVVPDSVSVVVEQYQVSGGAPFDLTGLVPGRRVLYQPTRYLPTAAVNAGDLAPFRYHLDYRTGRLTFYDPLLDADATTARDGLNPPIAVHVDPTDPSSDWLLPVIWVKYRYRNNRPTVDQVLLGRASNPDTVEATYRSLEAIDLKLVADVATQSTRGTDETYVEPGPGGTRVIDRPTGARRRLTINTTLAVGGRR